MSEKYFESRWSLYLLPLLLVWVLAADWDKLPRRDVRPAPTPDECLLDATSTSTPHRGPSWPTRVVVQLGDDIPQTVGTRLLAHLRSATDADVDLRPAHAPLSDVRGGALVVGLGDTNARRRLIEDRELRALSAEGYTVRSQTIGNATYLVGDGGSTRREKVEDVGAVYAAYAVLEELGFGFLHPLQPTVPDGLRPPSPSDRTTSPRWPVRGLQLHTMHPLELTDLLQGWGPNGPHDEAGWEAMLPEWDTFLEWMLANGQNRVHWVWLAADSWASFAESDERFARIRRLVDRAHELGIEVGLDVPLRLQQQNAARLIRADGDLEDEVRQIRRGVARVMAANFDYLVTEAGSTEFTAVDDERMVAWMNALTETAEEDHDVPVFIKVHASTGQHSEGFADPETGEPLNFNFLPHYADERLGVLPHTVQHYALDDPAPTYGNESFEHIRTFLQQQAGRRPTLWHPETAYWVSFDNDVPLYLPVYASRRVRDLRLLAADEDAGLMGRGEHAGASMDGQMVFSSGWEWGYWLQEVVAARAAWNPRTDLPSDEAALRAHLAPVARVFGAAGDPLVEWILEYARAQQELLIEGRIGGREPSSVARRNGQAFLQGWETWDDVSDALADSLGLTHGRMQPERPSFAELSSGTVPPGVYREEIAPLLEEMDRRFGALALAAQSLQPDVPAHALTLFEELSDAARVTALRARQIRALYAYAAAEGSGASRNVLAGHVQDARDALEEALGIVAHRETHYRVPVDRIAGWRKNPTVYPFTYLWSVRSLYYWQRDEAQALGNGDVCLFNIIDPVDVGLGDGLVSRAVDRVADRMALMPPLQSVSACLRAPRGEPNFLPAAWRH